MTHPPLEPAPPVGPNAQRVVDRQADHVSTGKTTIEDVQRMLDNMRPPQIEIVAVNGKLTPEAKAHLEARQKAAAEAAKSGPVPGVPAGVDLRRKLVLDTTRLRGALGRKAGRAQLKEARKAQLKHLKSTGYFNNPPKDQ